MRNVVLMIAVVAFLSSACSNAPKRKVAGGNAPPNAEVDTDGRIKNRSSMDNRKRVEYYNNVQHR